MSLADFRKLSTESKLNIIYNELLLIKERQRTEVDDRPLEVQTEFQLRKIPLNVCVCGHGSEDHETEFDPSDFGLDMTDGMCEKCICRKFIRATTEKKK